MDSNIDFDHTFEFIIYNAGRRERNWSALWIMREKVEAYLKISKSNRPP